MTYDLLNNPDLVKSAKDGFYNRTKNNNYVSPLE